MMQHKGVLDPRVSEKGWRIIEKEDRERANHAECIHRASSVYAAESGRIASWYCIIVTTGREKAVEKAMIDAGIDACAPMRMGKAKKRHRKLIPATPSPVLTGYIMVRCVFSDYAASGLGGFEHVKGMVGGWDGRHAIDDEKMNTFKRMAETGMFDDEKPSCQFRRGVSVEVQAGPFVGFRGPLVHDAMSGKGDAVVELMIFGRSTPVLIPLAILTTL